MFRYAAFLAIVVGSAATALAAIAPSGPVDLVPSHNVTVIEKNLAYPLLGPLIVEPCQSEDCSEA
jgi:hypothetical protein